MTTETDRELLELAAKAYWGDEIDDVVSIEWSEEDNAIAYTHADNQDHNGQDRTYCWSPLENDCNAFRLRTALMLDVTQYDEHSVAVTGRSPTRGTPGHYLTVREPLGDDPYAATRRAITRAAAEIGREMKGQTS